MNNPQKRNLMIALNEAFEMGKTIGRSEELIKQGYGQEMPNKSRKILAQAQRYRLEWLVNWWSRILEEDDDDR